MPPKRKLPSPERVFQTLNAYQRSEALKAAIELDVFTAIDEGRDTAAAIAARAGASERGVRVLCDYHVVAGFLTKRAGRYGLAPDAAAFLSCRSPACVAAAVRFLGSPMLVDQFRRLPEAVRRGGTAMENGGTLAPEHPIWVEFARGMGAMMGMNAELLAGLLRAERAPAWRVLDLAAGHGLFGIALARRNPRAEITAVDWPNVLEVAAENARAAGVAERHRGIAGSAFDVELGSGYDLALLTNFLHHFDPSANERLLRRVRAALKPGGRAVILEFVPDEGRISPPIPAAFSLVMLSSTPAGDAYTFSELRGMLRGAGFPRASLHPLPPSPQSAIIAAAR